MTMIFGQEFLRNPDRYVRVGARPPRGVLLVSFSWRSMSSILPCGLEIGEYLLLNGEHIARTIIF